jgi:hypothetical protein
MGAAGARAIVAQAPCDPGIHVSLPFFSQSLRLQNAEGT